MRSMFRLSIFGLLMVGILATASSSVFSQTPEDRELYATFTAGYARESADEMKAMSLDERTESVERRKEAIAAAKELIAKNPAELAAQITWLKGNLKGFEDGIKADEDAIASIKRFNAFDSAFKAKNWNAVFTSGEEILRADPDFYDVAIVMATAGYNQAKENKNALNDATIKQAMGAIRKIESGAKSKTEDCSGGYYDYSSKDFPNCMENSLGWLNYMIGYIKNYNEKKPDEAMQYFYKATKAKSETATLPESFKVIGVWYISKSQEIINQRKSVLMELNAEIDMPTQDAEKIKALEAKNANLQSIERGYLERAIDAYSRAYGLVAPADRNKEYGAGIFSRLKEIYNFRYEEPGMKTDAEINKNVAMVRTAAMPDPATEVMPVVEGTPAEPSPTATPATVKTGTERSRTVTEKTATTKVNN